MKFVMLKENDDKDLKNKVVLGKYFENTIMCDINGKETKHLDCYTITLALLYETGRFHDYEICSNTKITYTKPISVYKDSMGYYYTYENKTFYINLEDDLHDLNYFISRYRTYLVRGFYHNLKHKSIFLEDDTRDVASIAIIENYINSVSKECAIMEFGGDKVKLVTKLLKEKGDNSYDILY